MLAALVCLDSSRGCAFKAQAHHCKIAWFSQVRLKHSCSIVYDMNTPSESYEWFDMSISRADEFKLLSDRINIIEHAPEGQPQGPRLSAATKNFKQGKLPQADQNRTSSYINRWLLDPWYLHHWKFPGAGLIRDRNILDWHRKSNGMPTYINSCKLWQLCLVKPLETSIDAQVCFSFHCSSLVTWLRHYQRAMLYVLADKDGGVPLRPPAFVAESNDSSLSEDSFSE